MRDANPERPKLALGNRSDNYLAKAILLEEAAPPRYMETTVKLVLYAILAFVVWALFASLDTVTTASGQIMPIQSVQVVQHIDGGRIKSIDVIDGQTVTKGQLLISFNEAEPNAEYETVAAKYWALYARVERLRALLANRPANFNEIPAQYKTLVEEQKHTLKTSLDQIAQLEKEITILTEISKIRGDLAKDKLATRVQALDAQRNVNQVQAELLRFRRTNLDDLNTSASELAQTEEQLGKLRDRLERLQIVAPSDGVVQDLRYRTVGGVVTPGAVLMNVVPADRKLQAEVRVSPSEIGFVHVGQTARVKIGAYDYMRYGTLDGSVSMVSAFSTLDERQQPYFKVIVTLPATHLATAHQVLSIEPGMTVQADVVTDHQSVLRYLLRPIYVAFQQGMRER